MSTIEHEGLFDGTQFEIPFPKADGREVTDLALRLTGGLKLSRHDPDHVALVEAMTLGRMLTLTVVVSVDGKGQTFKQADDETETVTHTVALRIHDAEISDTA